MQVLLCISFIAFSYLLTSPLCFQFDALASKGSPSNLVLRMLVRDTKALVNALHALIFFGLTGMFFSLLPQHSSYFPC